MKLDSMVSTAATEFLSEEQRVNRREGDTEAREEVWEGDREGEG
jgi:hypothetical protein